MPAILATLEAEIKRIAVWGQHGQKVQKTSFNEKLGVEVHASNYGGKYTLTTIAFQHVFKSCLIHGPL
jgi:pyruvate dehydrogenase complex dehydrogenase (E1) component